MDTLGENKSGCGRDQPGENEHRISAVPLGLNCMRHAYNIIQSIMTTSLQQHNTPAMVSARLTSISLSTMTDDF